MTHPPTMSLVDEINQRQDEVLAELDDLNGQIEAVLRQFAPGAALGESAARDAA